MKFIEYLLEDVQQAALFSAEGVVVVNVPHPARYALHKLIVFAERRATRRVKANKDLRQSAALLSFYKATSAFEVDEAWKDLVARGPGWRERALRGRDALDAAVPELEIAAWLRTPKKVRAQDPTLAAGVESIRENHVAEPLEPGLQRPALIAAGSLRYAPTSSAGNRVTALKSSAASVAASAVPTSRPVRGTKSCGGTPE